MHRNIKLLKMASRRFSLDEALALLECPQEGDNSDMMEVVTQGSDDDLDAQELGECEFEDEGHWNGMESEYRITFLDLSSWLDVMTLLRMDVTRRWMQSTSTMMRRQMSEWKWCMMAADGIKQLCFLIIVALQREGYQRESSYHKRH
jgi:hypothetical protein